MDIFKCHDLKYLADLLNDSTISDELRIDAAYQYDRLKAHREVEAKANYDKNSTEPIINKKYADII